MVKKILFIAVILLLAAGTAAGILSRKAPSLLRSALARSLGKPVIVRDIEYRFPGTFTLSGFEVRETAPFAGELAFKAEKIRFAVSPMALLNRSLVIASADVEGAEIVVRKSRGRLHHALSAAGTGRAVPAEASAAGKPGDAKKPVPLRVKRFRVSDGAFMFVDYDVAEGGFVTVLEGIDAEVKNVAMPFADQPTTYRLSARVSQGREEKPAPFSLSGWTRFKSLDTDAQLELKDLALPYFRPYYAQVTPASIQSGALEARAALKIEAKRLTANADFAIVGLLFQNYEAGNELFGLNADEIIAFLKDSSGRLKFHIVASWDLADRSVKPRDVIRRSIERSLQQTVVANAGTILRHAIRKYGDVEDADNPAPGEKKDDIEDALDKVKAFFDR